MQSYARFKRENFFDRVDLKPENIHIPDGSLEKHELPDFCRRFEDAISAH